jgi:hypothetical protein
VNARPAVVPWKLRPAIIRYALAGTAGRAHTRRLGCLAEPRPVQPGYPVSERLVSPVGSLGQVNGMGATEGATHQIFGHYSQLCVGGLRQPC